MTIYQYCTPEWLESSAKGYRENPRFHKDFEKLTLKLTIRVNAEANWGIDKNIYFLSDIDRGVLKQLSFVSEEQARQESTFILAASPQEWKKILRKESKFVTDFLLGKITLVQGSKPGVLSIAPHSNTFVDTLTQYDLQFPDEMSPQELESYRTHMQEFRTALSV